MDRESILTVVELVDDPKVLDALVEQARGDSSEPIATLRAEKAIARLKEAIKKARETRTCDQLKSIRSLRDKHVAHYLTETIQEKAGALCHP
jgi:hypothetical protein